MKNKKETQAILAKGLERFNLLFAIISKVENDVYEVVDAISLNNSILSGQTFNLQNTYCVHTLKANNVTAYHHVAKSTIKAHPCYRDFGLESYIGCPIILNGKIFGTLNFSSPMPHAEFSDDDRHFVQQLAQEIAALLK